MYVFFLSLVIRGETKTWFLFMTATKLNAVYFIFDIKIILNTFRLKIERKSYLYCLSQLLHRMYNLFNK